MGLLRNTGQYIANTHLGTVVHGNDCPRRQHVLCRNIGARDGQVLTPTIYKAKHGANILGATSLRGIKHYVSGKTGNLVGLLVYANTINKVTKRDLTRDFGDDGMRMRLPLGHDRTSLDLIAIVNREYGTIGHFITLTVTTLGILHNQLARPRYRYIVTTGVFNDLKIL